jgi:hypothetical protein
LVKISREANSPEMITQEKNIPRWRKKNHPTIFFYSKKSPKVADKISLPTVFNRKALRKKYPCITENILPAGGKKISPQFFYKQNTLGEKCPGWRKNLP